MPEIDPPFHEDHKESPGEIAYDLARVVVKWVDSMNGPKISEQAAASIINAWLLWMRSNFK